MKKESNIVPVSIIESNIISLYQNNDAKISKESNGINSGKIESVLEKRRPVTNALKLFCCHLENKLVY